MREHAAVVRGGRRRGRGRAASDRDGGAGRQDGTAREGWGHTSLTSAIRPEVTVAGGRRRRHRPVELPVSLPISHAAATRIQPTTASRTQWLAVPTMTIAVPAAYAHAEAAHPRACT